MSTQASSERPSQLSSSPSSQRDVPRATRCEVSLFGCGPQSGLCGKLEIRSDRAVFQQLPRGVMEGEVVSVMPGP